MTNKPTHKDVWTLNVDSKLKIEIVHWGIDREQPDFEPLNDGKGVWNYYVFLPERLLKKQFKSIWLEDVLVQFTPNSPILITHDYYKASFNVDSWHGGVTYYEKIGQLKGYRCIKIGCDYSHLMDQKHGYPATLETVTHDAIVTAKELIELYKL